MWAGAERHQRKPACVLITWHIPCVGFIGHWISSKNVVLQRVCEVDSLVNRLLLANSRIGRSSAPGRSLCPKWWGRVGNGLHMTSCYFLSTQVALGIGSSTSYTGRLCLISGASSSAASLWFVRSVQTAPTPLELQAAIVLVAGMVPSWMCFRPLCPMNPVGQKTLLHPSTQLINTT